MHLQSACIGIERQHHRLRVPASCRTVWDRRRFAPNYRGFFRRISRKVAMNQIPSRRVYKHSRRHGRSRRSALGRRECAVPAGFSLGIRVPGTRKGSRMFPPHPDHRIVLTEDPQLGSISVGVADFFDFSFDLAEDLQDLIETHRHRQANRRRALLLDQRGAAAMPDRPTTTPAP